MNKSRRLSYAINNFLIQIKSKRRYNIPKDLNDVKLNLGCGLAVQPGWINIDGRLINGSYRLRLFFSSDLQIEDLA